MGKESSRKYTLNVSIESIDFGNLKTGSESIAPEAKIQRVDPNFKWNATVFIRYKTRKSTKKKFIFLVEFLVGPGYKTDIVPCLDRRPQSEYHPRS